MLWAIGAQISSVTADCLQRAALLASSFLFATVANKGSSRAHLVLITSNFFNSSRKKKATTSTKINNSLLQLDAAIPRLLWWKVSFYYKYQELLHAFQMGICISDEAKFIHILVANIRAEIREQISPPTLFADIKCQSNESLQRSQESACEMQFLLAIENLHAHCLWLIAPVLGRRKKNNLYYQETLQRIPQGGLRSNFINKLGLTEAKILWV